MDLSKAYYHRPHDLLITKLATYDLEVLATSLISDCIFKRYQRAKVGSDLVLTLKFSDVFRKVQSY